MQYMGGKHRLAKKIAEHIAAHRKGRPYLEPCVGGGSVLERVPQEQGRWAGDLNTALITLYQAVMTGWDPPTELSKDVWRTLKNIQDPHDPRTAFAGFGCSFMGMWFASYADRAGRTRRVLLRQREAYQGVTFMARSYAEWIPVDSMIYCDPPYANTEGYMTGSFDHAGFWSTLNQWTRYGNTILISEYTAPPGTPCVAEWPVTGRMKRGGAAVERLFLLTP